MLFEDAGSQAMCEFFDGIDPCCFLKFLWRRIFIAPTFSFLHHALGCFFAGLRDDLHGLFAFDSPPAEERIRDQSCTMDARRAMDKDGVVFVEKLRKFWYRFDESIVNFAFGSISVR